MDRSTGTTADRSILWRIMDYFEIALSVIPIIIMTGLVFVAVVCRYLLKSPIGWSEEFTLICMIWCVFGATPYAFRHGINVGVTFVVDRFSGRAREVIEIAIYIGTMIFLGVLLYASCLTLLNVVGKYSMAARIPLVIPNAAMPYGCVMSILRLIELISLRLKQGAPAGHSAAR